MTQVAVHDFSSIHILQQNIHYMLVRYRTREVGKKLVKPLKMCRVSGEKC